VYSALNRHEYQKLKNEYFWGVKRGRLVRLTTSGQSVSRLCRQRVILNSTQWPVTRTALQGCRDRIRAQAGSSETSTQLHSEAVRNLWPRLEFRARSRSAGEGETVPRNANTQKETNRGAKWAALETRNMSQVWQPAAAVHAQGKSGLSTPWGPTGHLCRVLLILRGPVWREQTVSVV
jgi:hypothetical protein